MAFELPVIRCPVCRAKLTIKHGMRSFFHAGMNFYVFTVRCLAHKSCMKVRSLTTLDYGRARYMLDDTKEQISAALEAAVLSPKTGDLIALK